MCVCFLVDAAAVDAVDTVDAVVGGVVGGGVDAACLFVVCLLVFLWLSLSSLLMMLLTS